MSVNPEILAAHVAQYFQELDASIHTLSNMQEGKIANLPSWVLSHRRITLAISTEHQLCGFSVQPEPSLEQDEVVVCDAVTDAQLGEILTPYSIKSVLQTASQGLAFQIGDTSLFNANNPYSQAKDVFLGIRGYCFLNTLHKTFSLEKARRETQNLWCNAMNGFPPQSSFPDSAGRVFAKFHSLVKLKNYKERKIHRYINDQQRLLLPTFKNCFFEHELVLETDKQKAVFVLERESLFPALLIELEKPSSKLFRKNGDLTAEANHAREQIGRWVRFIAENPKNSEGNMSFLRGQTDRLIVMGRGSESDIYNSRYADTRVWTYDVLLQEAKANWNRILAEQCRLLKIDTGPTIR